MFFKLIFYHTSFTNITITMYSLFIKYKYKMVLLNMKKNIIIIYIIIKNNIYYNYNNMDFTSKERDYLDTHPYKIEQLWKSAKDKPIINLPISAFKNSLSSKFWDDKDGNDISPYEVLDNPKKAPYHIKAINNADLDYPLIVAKSNLDVLDGLHRLCKCILLKKKYVNVQKINVSDLKKSIGGIKSLRKTSKQSSKKSLRKTSKQSSKKSLRKTSKQSSKKSLRKTSKKSSKKSSNRY